MENVIARVRAVPVPSRSSSSTTARSTARAKFLRSLVEEQSDLVIRFHEINRGKGAAIRTALAAATGDV